MLRCEMLEFCPKMTPFKLASATMMKKPFVDFNIKVAGMDIMGTKSMTNLVHSLFHKVLQSVAMYPKKIFVPMGELDDSVDIERLKALTPVGILYLTLERGVDLIEVSYWCSSFSFHLSAFFFNLVKFHIDRSFCFVCWSSSSSLCVQ
jgi:Ca2+-dependent lipid-binding protein